MVIHWFMVIGMALFVGAAAAKDLEVLEDPRERQSYALGMNFWNRLQDQSVEVDPEFYNQGFRDALSGSGTRLTEDQVRATLNDLQIQLKRQQSALQADRLLSNGKEVEAFLSENKTREGVITLASGLQYKVLTAGEGQKPKPNDTVVVQYRGTLVDGTQFDSSYTRGKPASFAVKQVIPGWREALQLMPVGSKWQIAVPPDLAYGKRGTGGKIGPDATLIFDVELLAIKDAAADQADQVADIKASFKLDPRLTRSLYMGDRWVSPTTYTGVRQTGKEYVVDARVHGIDAKGRPMRISPEWIPSDPEMVAVSPTQGNEVKIVVKHAGATKLKLATAGFSKELLVKAKYEGGTMQVEISQ